MNKALLLFRCASSKYIPSAQCSSILKMCSFSKSMKKQPFITQQLGCNFQRVVFRLFSNEIKGSETDFSKGAQVKDAKVSKKLQLKQAVRDYGATVIVFHVGISLVSLGMCYLAVDYGLDVSKLLQTVGFSEETVANRVATGGSTFVISYAVHKLFAPVRIAITLTATPIIVTYLRRIGFLKVVKRP